MTSSKAQYRSQAEAGQAPGGSAQPTPSSIPDMSALRAAQSAALGGAWAGGTKPGQAGGSGEDDMEQRTGSTASASDMASRCGEQVRVSAACAAWRSDVAQQPAALSAGHTTAGSRPAAAAPGTPPRAAPASAAARPARAWKHQTWAHMMWAQEVCVGRA